MGQVNRPRERGNDNPSAGVVRCLGGRNAVVPRRSKSPHRSKKEDTQLHVHCFSPASSFISFVPLLFSAHETDEPDETDAPARPA